MKEFRIYIRQDGINYQDWTATTHLDNTIIQTIQDRVIIGLGDKSGTSIPSAMARLFLMEHALKMVNHNHIGNTSNHELVSHYLDLLELIFKYPERLTFRWWDYNAEILKLTNSIQQHKSLQTSLSKAWKELTRASRLQNMRGLHLIFYKQGDAEILIGGTSPLTLVFTSPNLVRKMAGAGIDILGCGGNDLFYVQTGQYQPLALHQRAQEFRQFFHQYRNKYSIQLSTQSKSLDEYLMASRQNYDPGININNPNFNSDYPDLQFAGAAITAAGLPIKRDSGVNDPIDSEFMMKPTVQFFSNFTVNGATQTLQTPLMLTPGAHALMYWAGTQWDARFSADLANIRHIPVQDRQLPGFRTLYPFLTASDFLEEKLIHIDYKINKEKFFTGVNEDFDCLLPLRKEYFNYFTLNDLKDKLHISKDPISGNVTVKLFIPIKGNGSINNITVEKIYSDSDIVRYSNLDKIFALGIFPFYQTSQPDIDNYCIMLGDSTKNRDIDLTFYKFDQITNNHSVNISGIKKRGNRSYYHLESDGDNRFDCIHISQDGVGALIIPIWKVNDMTQAAIDFTFCVDFGTSNTHVAFKTNIGDVANAFNITDRDQQMVMLNYNNETDVAKGLGAYVSFDSIRKREFTPTTIDNRSNIKYPIRTVVFETVALNNEQTDLFGNINIGFSIKNEKEEGAEPLQRFESELKWAGVSAIQDKRIKGFCKQIIWMIKNKCLLNNGTLNPTIIWTRPEAMMVPVMNFYRNKWNDAINDVFGNGHHVNLVEQSESLAPYFSFVNMGVMQSSSTLNIDIGGGTTDILYLTPSIPGETYRQAYSSSVFFAANDLWGGGTGNPPLLNNKNGFYLLAKKMFETPGQLTLPNDTKESFAFFTKSNLQSRFTSSDVLSFVFGHDGEFMFTPSVQNNNKLYSLIFVHFAGIMYYIAQFMQKIGVEIPMNITFTGMGSLYIKMISSQEKEVTVLAKLLLTKFMGKEAPNMFNVKYTTAPKEITAEGAVLGINQINQIKENRKKHYGFAEDTDQNSFYSIKDIADEGLKSKVISNYHNFLNILTTDKDILNHLNQCFSISFDKEQMKLMNDMGEASFEQMYGRFNDPALLDNEIPESMFFWTLKETLYRASSLGI